MEQGHAGRDRIRPGNAKSTRHVVFCYATQRLMVGLVAGSCNNSRISCARRDASVLL